MPGASCVQDSTRSIDTAGLPSAACGLCTQCTATPLQPTAGGLCSHLTDERPGAERKGPLYLVPGRTAAGWALHFVLYVPFSSVEGREQREGAEGGRGEPALSRFPGTAGSLPGAEGPGSTVGLGALSPCTLS